jgi:hypothetical protein
MESPLKKPLLGANRRLCLRVQKVLILGQLIVTDCLLLLPTSEFELSLKFLKEIQPLFLVILPRQHVKNPELSISVDCLKSVTLGP